MTMEDILEELVGEIEDEYDPAARQADSSEFDGLLHHAELAAMTGIVLPEGPYETLAGYVMAALGHLPRAGEAVECDGHRLTVSELDGRRIARVRIDPVEDSRERRTEKEEAS